MNKGHFRPSFSGTTSAQLPQSTSEATVTRGAMALNPNVSTVESVGKLSQLIKACKIRHRHLVVCYDCGLLFPLQHHFP